MKFQKNKCYGRMQKDKSPLIDVIFKFPCPITEESVNRIEK